MLKFGAIHLSNLLFHRRMFGLKREVFWIKQLDNGVQTYTYADHGIYINLGSWIC